LLVSVLTLYSMMKIWMEAFWKPHPRANWQPPGQARVASGWVDCLVLAAITLAIGLNPQALLGFSEAAVQSFGGAR
jgi:multicomponent Na+:H+ antiporter subunit D